MKMKNFTTFALLLLVSVVVFAAGCPIKKKTSGRWVDDGVFRGKLFEKHSAKTPKGIPVHSGDAISQDVLPRIDAGIDKLFRIAAAPPNSYDVSDMTHSYFNVWLYRRAPSCTDAAFLVEATGSPYADTIWDKDPRPGHAMVCAAGMNVNEEGGGMVLVNDVDMLETVARYEGEHLLLYRKDRKRWTDTMYHADGTGHPLLGEEQGTASHKNEVIAPDLHVVHFEYAGKPHCVLLTK